MSEVTSPTQTTPRSPPKLPPRLNNKSGVVVSASANAQTSSSITAAASASTSPNVNQPTGDSTQAAPKKAIAIVTAEGKPKPKYAQPVSTPRKVPEPGSPAAEALKKITEMRAKGFKLNASDSMSVGPKQSTPSNTVSATSSSKPVASTAQTAQPNNKVATTASAASQISNIAKDLAKSASLPEGLKHGIHFHIHAPIHMHVYNAPPAKL